MRNRRCLALCGLLVLASSLPSGAPALAQETPGYDPDTAGGVEYQLPLPRTRREAAGRQADSPRKPALKEPAKPVPLFGAGTGGVATKRQAERTSSSSQERREEDSPGEAGASRGEDPPGTGSGNETTASADSPRTRKAATNSEGGGFGPGLTAGLLAVLLGAAIGIAVRMRTRRGEAAT